MQVNVPGNEEQTSSKAKGREHKCQARVGHSVLSNIHKPYRFGPALHFFYTASYFLFYTISISYPTSVLNAESTDHECSSSSSLLFQFRSALSSSLSPELRSLRLLSCWMGRLLLRCRTLHPRKMA
jgi:hypothetical protein